MNALFMTQSGSLGLFYNVAQALSKSVRLEKVGFYISDSQFYDNFKKNHPELINGSYELLKEWEIIRKSKDQQHNIERLRSYEELYGDPFLWNALVADRRIYLGSRATLEQDYASRFDHCRMLSIIQVAIDEMEALFDRVQPDLVVGFICVTIGDYLAYLIAKSRRIPFANLRPTRIKNFFYAAESILEPSKNIDNAYQQTLKTGTPKELETEIHSYLEEVRKTHAMYEGVVPANGGITIKKSNKKTARKHLTEKLTQIGAYIRRFYLYNFGAYKDDSSHRGVLYPLWFSKIKKPVRIHLNDFFLRRYFIPKKNLSSIDYVFYPLHKEPEVTLLVYSRAYLNQIEVVRNLARSLPVGMKLVVKEHPACLGYRPLSYYWKLLDIPNVVLMPAQTNSRDIIRNAKLIAVTSGSIGLEALMVKKPVIHFGRVPFSMLPDSMIRSIENLEKLPFIIDDLLSTHCHDEDALVAFIATIISSSVPVDFYSVLLNRKGVYRPKTNDNDYHGRENQIQRLAEYLIKKNSFVESVN